LVCAPFLLEATASDIDGSITNAELFMDANLLASFTNASYQTTVTYDFPSAVNFTLRATDNRGAVRTTNLTTLFVTKPLHVANLGGMQPDGSFKFCMLGEAGRDYEVLAKSSMATTNWAVIGVMGYTNGIWRYYDTNAATFERRYYKTRQLP
jgi:hypothetical protein